MGTNYDARELRQQYMELGVLEQLVKTDVTPSALPQRTAALVQEEADAEPRSSRSGVSIPGGGGP